MKTLPCSFSSAVPATTSPPPSRPFCRSRMISFGLSDPPARLAGQNCVQRPHSTQALTSRTSLRPRSLKWIIPRSSPSSRKARMGLVVSEPRKIVNGASTRCRCFEIGITSSRAKNDIVCAHQFTFQAMLPTGNTPQPNRYVTISAEIRNATTPDVADSFPSGLGRNTNRRNDRPIMATSTATAQTATNAPYQLRASVAFDKPRRPSSMCWR